ncbi:TPA: DUF4297 domain-containing protein [Vibrio parahaemolyticus]|nr:DUF4297 domain-containing protein [Vibrio parahaemolyticus]HAS6621333.1 DUF4297 domain-containing protein [Vibrio parahaemolyticus]HAS6631866.1 DUF4297 domain-containing protein [Vibrio parahaemolyticus]HAS6648362.1 DUF4297 domain-containing protein [Vibrio parahaemolyticus]HAS6653414.1 DUF4297 domain-containing protein [Vibrio parahaemolyticus]
MSSTFYNKSNIREAKNLTLYDVLCRFIWFNIILVRIHQSVYNSTCRSLFNYLYLVDHTMSKQLHDVTPREQNGRDSFERYRLQVRSASIAALTILEGSEIDRIYCDLHDDFVKRRVCGAYEFYQVKTKDKQNHNWKLNEVFGIKKNKAQNGSDIGESFIGKLLLHTIIFDEKCQRVVFQTNLNNEDAIEDIIKDIKSGSFSNKYTKVLVDKFNESLNLEDELSIDDIKTKLSKLEFENDVQYLKTKNNNFESVVRRSIYDYSEVDLSHDDTQEIIIKLLDLVESKSCGKIENITNDSIDAEASVSIDDLLNILSISRDAYLALLNGGDKKAIKNVSIIQRSLSSAGLDEEMVSFCSKCKLDWDDWVRNNRHNVSGMDLKIISGEVNKVLNDCLKSNGGFLEFKKMRQPIIDLLGDLKSNNLAYNLTQDMLLGAIFSELVKVKS